MAELGFNAEFDTSRCPLFRGDRAHQVIFQELQKFVRRALVKGKEIAASQTPTGATGNLKGSIVTRQARGAKVKHTGTVTWTAPYAIDVARGAGPRKVPLAQLVAWAEAVLGNGDAAVAISINIQRRGTPSPNHPEPGILMDLKTADLWTPIACDMFEATCRRIVNRLNKGG
jgi:hypothetical protein